MHSNHTKQMIMSIIKKTGKREHAISTFLLNAKIYTHITHTFSATDITQMIGKPTHHLRSQPQSSLFFTAQIDFNSFACCHFNERNKNENTPSNLLCLLFWWGPRLRQYNHCTYVYGHLDSFIWTVPHLIWYYL